MDRIGGTHRGASTTADTLVGPVIKGSGHPALRAATVPAEGSGYRGVALAHNLHSKAEVDSLMEQAVAAGATLVKQPQDVFWGGYSGYFADPDGHLWELAWNPHDWVGPRDE